MSETLPIVVLAAGQVLAKDLRVEIRLDGGFGAAGAAAAAASDGGDRFQAPGSGAQRGFWEEEVGAVRGDGELQRGRHGCAR